MTRLHTGVDNAVSAWRAAHLLPADAPHAHGTCPVCGCADCWGRLPASDGWWFCFNTDNHPVGLDHPGGWAGDSLDLETHRRGYEGKAGRLRVLREDGYLTASKAGSAAPKHRHRPSASTSNQGRSVVRGKQRPQRPPRREAAGLWAGSATVELGSAVLEDLASFYSRHEIKGGAVLPWKLACLLPEVKALPAWLPDPRGIHLALPLYDDRGRRAGLWPVAARGVPKGYRYQGLMAANPCAWVLLKGEEPLGWRWNGRVVVATTPGEFLRWASCESRHAVLGAWAPCWCRAAALCVPSEAEVIIRGPRPEPVASAFHGRVSVRY